MKKLALLMAAAVLFAFTGCNDDETTPGYGADIAGAYQGYTKANSDMFTGMITDGATMTVTENTDGTAKLVCNTASAIFGIYTVEKTTVVKKDGVYTVSGSGTVTAGSPGNQGEYPFTMSGNIKSATDVSVTFTLKVGPPMGDITVEFIQGTAPVE